MAFWKDFVKTAATVKWPDKEPAYTNHFTGMKFNRYGIPILPPRRVVGSDAHQSVMYAAPARRQEPRAVIKARRGPARGFYTNLGNPAMDEAFDAAKRSATTTAGRIVASLAGGPTVSDPQGEVKPIKLPKLPFRHYTLWDTEKDYQDRQHVSDPYFHNILVGGANAGGEGFLGMSVMPFGVLSKGPNREVFRNGQVDEIKAAIKASLERGEHPRVVGHSWGGSTVANLSKEYPNIPFIAADPVSWTGTMDEYPDNLTVLFPNPGTDQDDLTFAKLAPIFGHRWSMPKKGRVVRYDGGHVAGINEALDKLNYREWAKRDPMSFFGYYDEEGNRRPDVPKATVASGANVQTVPGGS